MRIRGTKPEFWKSKRIASVSWDARLVLKGLESYVDDNGVGVDDIELIVTDVFPRDMFATPRETVARVSEAITELFQAGLVHRYEANGDHLIYISFWESIQRIDKPGKGRNPRPDGSWDYKETEIRESVASPPEVVAPVTEEQRNRGTEEQGSKTAPPATPSNAPKTPAEEIATYAYDSTSGALKYMAVKGLAKWAIENKQSTPDQIKASIRDLYEMGKPLTKATLGQHLDGHIKGSRTRPATENRMQDILAIGEQLDSNQQRQIGA